MGDNITSQQQEWAEDLEYKDIMKAKSLSVLIVFLTLLCILGILFGSLVLLPLKSSLANVTAPSLELSLGDPLGTVLRSSDGRLPKDSPSSSPSLSSLLLSVPFYVYEELAWTNATLGGVSLETIVSAPGGRGLGKHSNDYWFMKAALRHPQRTLDPSKAKLFVVPLLLNLYSLRVFEDLDAQNVTICNSYNSNPSSMTANVICERDLLVLAGKALNQSRWFHRHQGRDHIATTSHYGYKLKGHLKMPALLRQAIYKCNSITFEQRRYNDPTRIQFPSYLVGAPCPPDQKKLYDLALIASIKPNDERFVDRRRICDWIAHDTNYSIPICGPGLQCPVLAQAKFGFHVRGDTWGSQRLMDTILSGTVPIVTRQEQYHVVPSWIDWNQLTYYANVSTRQAFLDSLNHILQDMEGYHRRHDAIIQNRPLFDWTTLIPFDTYMFMLQASLYPESIPLNLTSNFSALILPTLSVKE